MRQRVGFVLLAIVSLFLMSAYWKRARIDAPTSSPFRLEPSRQQQNTHQLKVFSNSSSLFLYRAYHTRSGRIRIFSVNKCLPTDFLVLGKLGMRDLQFSAQPLEGQCPWNWAEDCDYNTYVLESRQILSDVFDNETLTIFRNNNSIEVPLYPAIQKLKTGLTVCVPPLYWYTDWVKLILFMEWWKVQGVSKFIVYYHSTNEEVKTVLDHYIKQKAITLIPWPLLPVTEDENPNLSLYRLAHSMAHNDCVQRIETKLGALVDIDEMLLIKNQQLVQAVNRMFKLSPNIASFRFSHSVLQLQPPLYDYQEILNFESTDFQGVLSPSQVSIGGPTKTIFRTATVKRLSTHQVAEFENPRWTTQILAGSTGILLHNRYNYANGQKYNSTIVNIMPPGLSDISFQSKLVKTMKYIFPNGSQFNPKTQIALGNCLGSWRVDGCKTPMSTCREEMEKMENWTFAEQLSSDVYRLI